MWEMWCGCRAYTDNSPLPRDATFQAFIDYAHAGGRPEVPDKTVTGPDPDYMRVICKAWAQTPEARPSLANIRSDLGKCAYGFHQYSSDFAVASIYQPNQNEAKKTNMCIIQ